MAAKCRVQEDARDSEIDVSKLQSKDCLGELYHGCRQIEMNSWYSSVFSISCSETSDGVHVIPVLVLFLLALLRLRKLFYRKRLNPQL